MPLYEVAILEKPTKNEAEDGKQERLVLAPKPVVARDPQAAAIGAVMEAKLEIDLSRAEVIVRPFA